MYFTYLDLPAIPEEFIGLCIKNIELIGTDPSLEKWNNFRQDMNRATWCPRHVINWLIENIKGKFPDLNGLDFAFLNVTTYINGKHPKHVDIGRNYALNYYFDTGGTHTNVTWFDADRETVLHLERDIQPNRWALLKVNPTVHEVDGIEPGRRRVFISMSIEEGAVTDEEAFFKQIEHMFTK